MFGTIFKRFSGRHYKKFYQKCVPLVARINELEATYQGLSDEALRAKTDEFRQRFKAGETLRISSPRPSRR
jgi:preprotein translocase subunit SecA